MRKKMSEVKVDIIANTITVTKSYYKRALDPNSNEYRILQEVLIANPNCRIVTREIKHNPKKKRYKGLTYDYMREYIKNNESKENVESALSELEHLIEISKCHSNGYRYPTIKKWFLEKYKDVADFGKETSEIEKRKATELAFPNMEDAVA